MGLAAVGWLVAGPVNGFLRWAFEGFNAAVRHSTTAYTRAVGGLLRVSVLVLVVYGGLLGLTYFDFKITPKGFIPAQDMGYLILSVQLPDAASAERSREITDHVQQICLDTPGIKHTVAVAGQSFAIQVNSSNFGAMFVILDDFANRQSPDLSADAIAAALKARLAAEVPGALISVFPAAPIRGVGRTGGFKVMVEDRGDFGLRGLQQQADNLTEQAGRLPNPYLPAPAKTLVMQPNIFRADAPQLFVDINRSRCLMLDMPLVSVTDTLGTYLGSLYVNDFNLFGHTWEVIVQADAKFRNQVDQLRLMKVRNNSGAMVPLGTLIDVKHANGPLILTRYNTYPAAAINGNTGPGVSSRQAIDIMQRLADRELPSAMVCEWTEMAYLELQAGNTAMAIFGLAVVMVFLMLAAQYESWSLPLAIILVVPMCLLSAVVGVTAVPGGFGLLQKYLHISDSRGGRPIRHQYLHPDRLRRPGGPGQQERDLDRRVRQARPRDGGVAPRGGPGSMPPPPPAHRHDFLRLHPRRVSALDRPRRRRRDAPHPGHGRLQRHVGRHHVRHLPHADLLQRHRLAGRPAAVPNSWHTARPPYSLDPVHRGRRGLPRLAGPVLDRVRLGHRAFGLVLGPYCAAQRAASESPGKSLTQP